MNNFADAAWQPSLGALPGSNGGTRFRVWAPKPATIELVLSGPAGERAVQMERAKHGAISQR